MQPAAEGQVGVSRLVGRQWCQPLDSQDRRDNEDAQAVIDGKELS